MSRQKPSLPPDIAQVASEVEPYEDRRATPAPKRDYYVEEDPILAEGDPLAQRPEPEDAGSSFEEYAINTTGMDPSVPAIEIPKDADPISRLAAAMEKLASQQRASSPVEDSLMAKILLVLEKVATGQAASTRAAAEALAKGKDPSNFFSTEISAFNPRGEREYPRPMLKCKMHLPWEAERECLTREEIELLNLLEPGDYLVQRNDDSNIKLTVRARLNSNTMKPEVLLMNTETGFNNDYAWLMPPLRRMLRQMLQQRMDTRDAADRVMTMEQELDLIAKHGIHFDKVIAMQQEVNA